MLVLSRKKTQRICFGDSIVVTIVDIGGDRVKVGIEAPKDVEIWRDEIAEKKATGQSSVLAQSQQQAG